MNIKDKIKSALKKLFSDLYMKQDQALMLSGKMNAREVIKFDKINSLSDIEFKVYSQWGEDGIIQYLIDKIDIPNKIFIEFGVQDYTESNTRFLLKNDNWSGLVMDGSEEAINYIKKDDIYWRYDLVAKKAFITKDNINKLISDYTNIKDIGLLSIDIDGNDYWVWDAINCIEPRIVICEYNANFGNQEAITIPYKEDFYRTQEHYSNLYYGVSYKALISLGEKKGYTFIGCNSNGNNMFFVKNEYASKFDSLDTSFVLSKFKEGRNLDGTLLNERFKSNLIKIIEENKVYDIKEGKIVSLKELGL